MSENNLEVVRRAIEANRSGPPEDTVEKALALADPDFVFRSRLASVEGTTYRGHEGGRAYYADMGDAWREWRIELQDITEVAPNAVLTESTFHATGHSGVEVEQRSAIVWLLSGGKVREIHVYPTRQEALEAARLA